jgi:sulfatase modifying factor 1
MSIRCRMGFHQWVFCKCSRCSSIRSDQHDWHGCRCSACGCTRDEMHEWRRCKCAACGRSRDKEHAWQGEKCVACGATRTKMSVDLSGGPVLQMAWCPAGSFTMGSPATEDGRNGDETRHQVTLTKGFWIGQYQVTQAQWEQVMGENPSEFKGPNLPVESVTWHDCQRFIATLNDRVPGSAFRLPTEAEWEYACRAGTGTAVNSGNGLRSRQDMDRVAWIYVPNSRSRQPQPVGLKAPNAWGLFDMHGNVSEWCSDWYEAELGSNPATDPLGPDSGPGRVHRGGSWASTPVTCRSASRAWDDPGRRRNSLGLRLALVLA